MPRKQKRIAAADCETPPFKFGRKTQAQGGDLAPFVWGYFDGETYVYFWDDDPEICTRNFIEYLQDEDDLIVYMHNGGKFDFHFMLPYLDPDIMMINGRIAEATLFNGRVTIRDSYLILPIPLALYNKEDIDYALFEPETRNRHKNQIIHYLGVDCRSLYDLVSNFSARFGNNLTLASTAFKQLRKTGYDVGNTFETFDNLFRPFYFGGRVQCFDVGSFKGSYQYVDINSAYPKAMTDRHWYGGGYYEHLRIPDKENGSWYAEIKAVAKGSLPYRFDNKLYFPNDNKQRTYFASGWEINKGLETGTLKINKVVKVYRPNLLQDFGEYVSKFFDEKASAKLAGDFFMELFAKLMLNSAYGKFGQDGRSFEKMCIVPSGEWPENDPKWEHDFRWRYHSDTGTGYTIFVRSDPQYKFYNVATAASVTGYVRAFLWGSILQCERPLYCDTDSIICERFNGDVGPKLGQWKLEANLTEINIAQRKMYAGRVFPVTDYGPIDETKVASKGVRLSYEELSNEIKRAGEIKFKKESPAVSLQYGFRYFEKTISFENLQKNVVTNPD